VPFYLASGGRANSLFGDGVLSPSPLSGGTAGGSRSAASPSPCPLPEREGSGRAECDEYAYDPDDPTPYLYDAGTLQAGGPFDARPVQRRDDVLCYTTAPLEQDLVVCGPVHAELWVSTSAADSEFCAMLCDVYPNGLARQLCDGNVRLALRESLEKPDPVPPGRVVKVRIDLWATGVRVFAGHRLRLQVASAAVPKFAAHTNTLDPPGSATKVTVARNRVFHDERHRSRLWLPVVDGAEAQA